MPPGRQVVRGVAEASGASPGSTGVAVGVGQPSRPARPTLEMVAAAAGVSRGTASRALNGEPNVSSRAVDAVIRAAAELGYRPNLTARSLVLGRSDSVALVISESDQRLFTDPFFAAMMRTVHRELSAASTQLVLALARGDREREQLVRFAAGRHLDGVLLISLRDGDPMPAELERAGIPVVTAGRGTVPVETEQSSGTNAPGCWVDVDNRGGARAAVEHLTGLGRREIVTIAGPQDMSPGRDRMLGWTDALAAAGLPARATSVVFGDFTEVSGYIAMRDLLHRLPTIDAVFAASDLMALGALRALRMAGRRVPQDVAVVGFEDAPAARLADPPLTTVRQPVDELGKLMVRILLARIRGESTVDGQVVLSTELVRRSSA